MISEEHLFLLQKQHTKDVSTLQLGKIVDILEKENISLLSQKDPQYPLCFLQLQKPPILLYVKGTLPKNIDQAVTMIGTRNATHYGKGQAYQIARELASKNIPIVSGLARGIDSAAHQGALETGITIAIIASGFCKLYPKENQDLANQISKKGALISEYSPFMPPSPYTFIQRNRLLAALGSCSLLIESPEKGGSMVTMEIAKSLQRPLFALPGTVDLDSFRGNFLLIKRGEAQLLESAQDIFQHLFRNRLLKEDIKNSAKKRVCTLSFSMNEKKVFDLITEKEIGLDELLLLTQYPIMQLNALLTSLLLHGVIEELAGKMYKKK